MTGERGPGFGLFQSLLAVLVFLSLFLTLPAFADGSDAGIGGWQVRDMARVRLLAATTTTGAGQTVEAGLEIVLAPGWKMYGETPGDAGAPPHLDWTGSQNLQDAEILWPKPELFTLDGLKSYGYHGTVLLPLRLALQQPGQPLDLALRLTLYVCNVVCMPVNFTVALALQAGDAHESAGAVVLRQAFGAVVSGTSPPDSVPLFGFLWVLLTALLGGLILNVMPCVLPVLSLKLLTVLQHREWSARTVRIGFLSTAAGILFSFLVLAAGAIALRSAGLAVGWGMQFQQPAFLIFMIVLLALFIVNLWGGFEILLPRWIMDRITRFEDGHGITTSFATGAFATLLATPCTAPFVGTAIAFALTHTATETVLVFTALGLGFCSPYLLVAAYPALARKLPRPGAWMGRVRIALGAVLLLTIIWLGSVLAAQTSIFAAARTSVWQPFDESRIAAEVAKGHVVFIDITADWCLTCVANERFVLDQAKVQRVLFGNPDVIPMRGDWTKPDPQIGAYLAKFNRYGVPFNAVYGPAKPEGQALPELLTTDGVLDAVRAAQH
jgi:cytochrome c biogenesis protein CcdA